MGPSAKIASYIMINRFRPTNTFYSTVVFNPQIHYAIGPPIIVLVPSVFVSPMKTVEEISPHEWKNTTALAIPTISVPPPIKVSLDMFSPFSSFAMKGADDYVMTESDYQAMNTSISAAEFVLE